MNIDELFEAGFNFNKVSKNEIIKCIQNGRYQYKKIKQDVEEIKAEKKQVEKDIVFAQEFMTGFLGLAPENEYGSKKYKPLVELLGMAVARIDK
jgi:hypothetical protein